jgi:phosphatidylglycerophosphate synthase
MQVFSAMKTELLLGGVVLMLVTVLLGAVAAGALELGADFVFRAGAAFLAATLIVSWLAARAPDLERFGAANRITLLRVALVALVAAAAVESPDQALSWVIIGVVTVALILDGFDGRIARRTNSSSHFGARFDLETDAALILVLSVLSWQFGKAGVWILAAGAMRYCFVFASRLLTWMRAPLPPSRRRQAVCILQSAGLLAVISPLFPHPASDILAAATLLMLTVSFAIDVHWLWARRYMPA